MVRDGLDEVGYWTEIKLEILREYAQAYAAILHKQSAIKHVAYIDGFAGAGTHVSRSTGRRIEGSPRVALSIEPPFSHCHFVDLDGKRASRLRELAAGRQHVTVYEGDCNDVLVRDVFPQCRYEDYRRALCLLDPYKLNPKWHVVQAAGRMRSIEIFLNFMIMDANMNVLRTDPDCVSARQAQRMNEYWGDSSWRQVAYRREKGLFGDIETKVTNEAVAEAYRTRLREVAGFKYVPEPLPMVNSTGAVIYYLFFASHNRTGDKIARAVFRKYKGKGRIDGDELQHRVD
jgi:three-Cys-motif partner protein